MGSLPSKQHMDNSPTPSWNSECRCGLGLTSLQRTHGVDSGQVHFHTYSKKILHSTSRYVCISTESLTTEICVTTPRSRGDECGCNDLAIEQMDIIHSPPPSIVMLPCILKKIREDQATCLLIAPNWLAQTWYPLMLQLFIDIPAILPMSEHSIYLPFNRQARHPLWRALKLAVWPLSGDAVKQEAFHHRCATYSWPPGEMDQKDTKVPGSYGLAGVCQGIPVHFQPLLRKYYCSFLNSSTNEICHTERSGFTSHAYLNYMIQLEVNSWEHFRFYHAS